MSQRQQFLVVHVADYMTGHYLHNDCWCEPTIYWLAATKTVDPVTGETSLPILVIEHNDETFTPHEDILVARENEPDWVTELLDSLL